MRVRSAGARRATHTARRDRSDARSSARRSREFAYLVKVSGGARQMEWWRELGIELDAVGVGAEVKLVLQLAAFAPLERIRAHLVSALRERLGNATHGLQTQRSKVCAGVVGGLPVVHRSRFPNDAPGRHVRCPTRWPATPPGRRAGRTSGWPAGGVPEVAITPGTAARPVARGGDAPRAARPQGQPEVGAPREKFWKNRTKTGKITNTTGKS